MDWDDNPLRDNRIYILVISCLYESRCACWEVPKTLIDLLPRQFLGVKADIVRSPTTEVSRGFVSHFRVVDSIEINKIRN